MAYICPYCNKNVYMNVSLHWTEHNCKGYNEHIETLKKKRDDKND